MNEEPQIQPTNSEPPMPPGTASTPKNTKKFVLVALIVLLALLAAGGAIWLFLKDKDEPITSFEQCKAAGNPIQESYPERCTADGQTFVNPNQQVQQDDQSNEEESVDETASWFLYEPQTKAYTVRIPDGWELISHEELGNVYGKDPAKLVLKPGTKGSVTPTEAGWDGYSPFTIYVPGDNFDHIVKRGEKQGTVKAASGQEAEKYYYVETSEAEDVGSYMKGTKVYGYYFGANGKYIHVIHAIDEGQADQHELVEKMIGTLTIK